MVDEVENALEIFTLTKIYIYCKREHENYETIPYLSDGGIVRPLRLFYSE